MDTLFSFSVLATTLFFNVDNTTVFGIVVSPNIEHMGIPSQYSREEKSQIFSYKIENLNGENIFFINFSGLNSYEQALNSPGFYEDNNLKEVLKSGYKTDFYKTRNAADFIQYEKEYIENLRKSGKTSVDEPKKLTSIPKKINFIPYGEYIKTSLFSDKVKFISFFQTTGHKEGNMSTDPLYLGVLIETPNSVKEYTEFPYMFIPWRSIIN